MAVFDLPVREALRTIGEATVVWTGFDADWYRAAHAADLTDPESMLESELFRFYLDRGQRLGHSPNRLFDEAWHLRTYPGIAELVRAGEYASAFDAYCRGGNRDRTGHGPPIGQAGHGLRP